MTVTGELDGALRSVATTVTLTVENGTADSSDYSATGATLTIPSGRTSGTANVYITPDNDTSDEADETVNVVAASTFSVSPSSLPVTIEDDDGPPTGIDLTVSPSRVREDAGLQSIRVTARLTGGGTVTDPTDVALSVVDGTAIEGTHFEVSTLPTLTIPANSQSGTANFDLTPTDNERRR